MSGLRDFAEWTWYAEGTGAALTREMLRPASWLFSRAVATRNARFDRAPRHDAPLPALSIGNLTVGGTGKTPVSSWFAARLHARGAHPALILRGYGDDEWRVHELLTPSIPVRVAPDRLQAMHEARAAGADCVVLDDAFQHRRAPRVSDVVLISADRWTGREAVLPAGPFRESMHGLMRATAAIITVKAASADRVQLVERRIREVAPGLHPAIVRLVPEALHTLPGTDGPTVQSLEQLAGARVMALSAIADPEAFARQLRGCGAHLVHEMRFPDHHRFSPADLSRVSDVLHGVDLVVCTLKDAVKLAPIWPREATRLWYVSQTLVVDRGAEILEQECDRVLAAR